ncbi:transcriptional regulator, TetR family [Prauserella flava]|nr:transcriptional regulator, TetR family [Prauserella flava]MCR3732641.1 transcriptional regulator, TetR family [Prauserella salsuginis]
MSTRAAPGDAAGVNSPAVSSPATSSAATTGCVPGVRSDGERRSGPAAFRRRLLDGLAAELAAGSYRDATVAGIVRRARTSRRTFYQHFADRDECFVTLMAETTGEMVRYVSEAVDETEPWPEQVRSAVEAWFAYAEAEPAIVVSWIRDVPALGDKARQLQRMQLDGFVTLAQRLRQRTELRGAGAPVPRESVIILLGGLRELVATTVEDGGSLDGVVESAVHAAVSLLTPQ